MVLIEFLDTVQLETQFDLFLAIFYLPIGHRISELFREPHSPDHHGDFHDYPRGYLGHPDNFLYHPYHQNGRIRLGELTD